MYKAELVEEFANKSWLTKEIPVDGAHPIAPISQNPGHRKRAEIVLLEDIVKLEPGFKMVQLI